MDEIEQIVTMSIPDVDAITPENNPVPDPLSSFSPEEIELLKQGGVVEKAIPLPPTKDPNRNEKGQWVKGNDASVGNEGGRPCRYCEEETALSHRTAKYIERCTSSTKPMIPYIEELALEMGVDDSEIVSWANKVKPDTEELEHPEFNTAYKRIKMIQKLRLQQRTQGRFNPTGAIFLLKANHGFMESEKRILAGDKDQPMKLEIEITEEKKREEASE